jgi:hypothetical protein
MDPVRSRCLCVRVAAPSLEVVQEQLYAVAKKENLQVRRRRSGAGGPRTAAEAAGLPEPWFECRSVAKLGSAAIPLTHARQRRVGFASPKTSCQRAWRQRSRPAATATCDARC